jgi:hypothetical protein
LTSAEEGFKENGYTPSGKNTRVQKTSMIKINIIPTTERSKGPKASIPLVLSEGSLGMYYTHFSNLYKPLELKFHQETLNFTSSS